MSPGPHRLLLLEFLEPTLWAWGPVPQPLGEIDLHVQAHTQLFPHGKPHISEFGAPSSDEAGQGSNPETTVPLLVMEEAWLF